MPIKKTEALFRKFYNTDGQALFLSVLYENLICSHHNIFPFLMQKVLYGG